MTAKWRICGGGAIIALFAIIFGARGQQQPVCVDYSKDPAGCQPSTFDTPIGKLPTVRVNRVGDVDPFSSEEDARAGASALEKSLHLFRNFEHLQSLRP